MAYIATHQGRTTRVVYMLMGQQHHADVAGCQADLRQAFIDSLPSTLYALRMGMQGLIKAENEMTQLRHIYDLYRRVH